MNKLIVYFEDRTATKHPIGEVKDRKEAWDTINNFLIKHNYKAPYVREWDEETRHWWDVGSHSEFFFMDGEEYGLSK